MYTEIITLDLSLYMSGIIFPKKLTLMSFFHHLKYRLKYVLLLLSLLRTHLVQINTHEKNNYFIFFNFKKNTH